MLEHFIQSAIDAATAELIAENNRLRFIEERFKSFTNDDRPCVKCVELIAERDGQFKEIRDLNRSIAQLTAERDALKAHNEALKQVVPRELVDAQARADRAEAALKIAEIQLQLTGSRAQLAEMALEKSEAANAQMREALERTRHLFGFMVPIEWLQRRDSALSTDAGRGWVPRERFDELHQWAVKACERDKTLPRFPDTP